MISKNNSINNIKLNVMTNLRPITLTNEIGKKRQATYKAVISRYNDVIEAGFYLEAITLMESLISDRIESYFIWETAMQKKYSFKQLGWLISQLDTNKDSRLPKTELEQWWKLRNETLHELAKINENDDLDFNEKYAKAKLCAEKGKPLFRKVDNVCRM